MYTCIYAFPCAWFDFQFLFVWFVSEHLDLQIVKDGYQWRKYGQKVTRDNPSPRAYFKCSFAPSCPVKKKVIAETKSWISKVKIKLEFHVSDIEYCSYIQVQRSAEDPTVLVATYEGEHNHLQPSKPELPLTPSQGSTFCPVSPASRCQGPALTLDKFQSGVSEDAKKSVQEAEAPGIGQILVQQMAASLTRDPNFTAALAAAISGRFVDQGRTEKWWITNNKTRESSVVSVFILLVISINYWKID